MKIPIQLKYYLAILLFAIVSTGLSCYSKPAFIANLKTEIPEDPYADDGLSFRVFCYHDVRDNLRQTIESWPERSALDTYDLIQQFEWLRESGYHVVSLDAVLAARNGGPKLPDKALLLSFDDGYCSMYTRVFPLLKLYNYPAILSLVGGFMEEAKDGQVFCGDRSVPREQFVTWPQVREMVASGLVEVASHSYSLHKGVTSNPQGSMPPAATTHIYNAQEQRYESDADYYARIRADLARNSAMIERETGKRPRVMTWPYGAYNMLCVQAAEAEGMPITMNLEAGPNTPDVPLYHTRRVMRYFPDRVRELKDDLRQQSQYAGEEQPLTRVVAVDLDSIYDTDPVRQGKNLDDLIERIYRLRIDTVYLRIVSDADHDGDAEAAYFPNRHLPLRADLFNRVSFQLRTRASVPFVYAWLPVLAFDLPSGHSATRPTGDIYTSMSGDGGTSTVRLSPVAPIARQTIKEIYEDAAKNAPAQTGGILLDDDMGHGEFDADYLTCFLHELITIFKFYQPDAITARIVSPDLVFASNDTKGTAQSFSEIAKHYDFVTVAAMPAGEDANNPERWLKTLVGRVAQTPETLKKTVFLLASMDRQTGKPIDSKRLAAQLRLVQQNGVRNFGYYPDLAPQDHPALSVIRPAITLKMNPGRLP